MLIKVCGLRNKQNIAELAQLPIDFIGFIFYSKSKRYAIPELDSTQVANLGIKKVGVFVNEKTEKILEIVDKFQLNALQLHGNESPSQVELLKNKNLQIIKAFSITTDFSFKKTKIYESLVDYFLFDTATVNYGGSGQKFNWEILKNYKSATPFLLSGGISEVDIDSIKEIAHPKFAGIDINSKFELSAGLKDTEKIKSFIQNFK